MGILYEDSLYLQNQKETKESLAKAAKIREQEEIDNAYLEREAIKEAAEKKINDFYKYKNDVKKALLSEALLGIYQNVFINSSIREEALTESLMNQYIDENGTTNILKKMKYSDNLILKNLYEAVMEKSDEITKDATSDDPSTQIIDKDNIKDFWKEIDNSEDVEDATNIIRLRVANAEEDFVNRNQQDKANIDTILKDTASRIQTAKSGNDNEYAEDVEESETRLAKDRIYQIQHESRRNVFDRMVRSLSEVVVKNEDIKKEFTLENGRLDMDRIVESVRCMYGLLEMVSTLGLENVDEKYIEDTIKSIK